MGDLQMGEERESMTTYLAEWYLPAERHASFPSAARRLADAVAEITSARTLLRYLGAALSVRDETAFCLLEGPSEESLEEAARRVGVRFDRIGEALYVPAKGVICLERPRTIDEARREET
jgi:hypothetical protein